MGVCVTLDSHDSLKKCKLLWYESMVYDRVFHFVRMLLLLLLLLMLMMMMIMMMMMMMMMMMIHFKSQFDGLSMIIVDAVWKNTLI